MSSFSERLKQLRGSESQASFAAAMGVNRVQYLKYESGKNAPSIEFLEKLCRIHACSSDWILGLERRPSPSSVNVRGDCNAVATGPNAKVSVVSTQQANCKTCPHLRKLKQLEKLLAK